MDFCKNMVVVLEQKREERIGVDASRLRAVSFIAWCSTEEGNTVLLLL